jgi:TRAP-type C4-dicarboxylate transport system permease small subunit
VPEIKEIAAELQFISDRLSTQIRTVGLGLLAISWTVLVGDSEFLRKLSDRLGRSLLIVSTLCVFVLFIDFLQYVVGYIYAHRTLVKAEAKDLKVIEYERDNLLFKSRSFLFWSKQLVMVGTLVFFLYAFACYVYF